MMEFWNFFAEPFAYDFMQRALLVAVLVGAVSAALSCFLVLKGWSLMGDAISHAVLPGIVIAFVAGLPLAVGAFAAGLFSAVATGYLKANSRVKEDTVMGIVFSGMFGLGLVLFTRVETDQHLSHILFGNMLGVTAGDLIETAVVAGGTLLIVLAKRRDLLLYCFDPQHARAVGLPVGLLHYGLLVLLSLTIVASLKAVGIILVVAMLIAPGAIGFLLTRTFGRMLVVAMSVAIGSSVLGTFVSFHIDAATGPCIVLIQTLVFLFALLFAPGTGLLMRRGIAAPLPAAAKGTPKPIFGRLGLSRGGMGE
jgi:manganese/iron transport system permease protein